LGFFAAANFEKGPETTVKPAKRSLSTAEVAERAALPRAGARRLLHTLVRLGYARVDDGRFELTPKIIELGRAFLTSATNYDLVRPVIESLSRDTGELCTMSVLDGVDVVYVARIEPVLPLTEATVWEAACPPSQPPWAGYC
jgi:IclR family transcriptional regulator, pca regulon regulatory protein